MQLIERVYWLAKGLQGTYACIQVFAPTGKLAVLLKACHAQEIMAVVSTAAFGILFLSTASITELLICASMIEWLMHH